VSDPLDDALAEQMMSWILLSMKQRRAVSGMRLMVERGLSVPQIAALHVCVYEPHATLSTLVEHLSLSPSAVSALVQKMVEQGLLTRVEDARDRRQKRVGITAEGRRIVEELAAARFDDMRAAFVPLSTTTKRAFARVLDDVVRELTARAGALPDVGRNAKERTASKGAHSKARAPRTKRDARVAASARAPRTKLTKGVTP